VYRVGDGTSSLVNTGNPVFIDEFAATGGPPVQTIALPTTATAPSHRLIASGTASSEGLLTLSTDGHYLLLTGYDATPGGATNLTTSPSASILRTVARIDSSGTAIDTTTALNDLSTAASPRAAASTNGTDLWVGGGAGGVRYATLGASTSVQLSSTVTNIRAVNIFNGQVYNSDASGSTIRLGAVGTGLPTTIGQTITNIPGFATTGGSPYAFYFADLDAGTAGVDTLYVADDGAGLQKYSLVSGSWTANGTVGTASDTYRGVTGVVSAGSVTLYAVRKGGTAATGGGELVSLTDASGYNGAFSGTPTVLSTAAANTAYRGVALMPQP
jgi:hypothetical protein